MKNFDCPLALQYDVNGLDKTARPSFTCTGAMRGMASLEIQPSLEFQMVP
jgi:hypothetical protein